MSGKCVIKARDISKKYILGGPREQYKTIQDLFSGIVRKPFLSPSLEISKTEFWALTDISFDINESEVIGIIGKNGAGKSTLLKIMSRITKPTSGSIAIHGRIGSLLEVGTGFHPELTGRENIFLNGSILGMRKTEIEAKFDEIVKFSEIERFLDTPVKRYSSGMYVRLAFSVAAVLDTEILLIDEVLAVGDAAFQKKSLSRMKNITNEGRTVIIVSHSMPIIRNNCDKVMYLKTGRIVQFDSPDSTIDTYLHSYESQKKLLVSDITPEMHKTGISKIIVKKIQIVDESGKILENVKYHQPIFVEACLEVVDEVDSAGFMISVSTVDNVLLLSTHCFDRTNEYWNLSKGNYRVRIELRNELKKGYYNILFGAHQKPMNVSLFHIPDAISFEVLDTPFDKKDMYSQYNTGLVDAYSDWSIEQI